MTRALRSSGAVAAPALRAADAMRARIVAVAAALFITRGFGGTTMQDIADVLEISRPKLYYYFRDKSAILGAAVRNVTVEAERRARLALKQVNHDPALALRQMVEGHARLILERPTEFRLLDMSIEHLDTAMKTRAARAKRGLLELFTEVIRLGVARGTFRVVDPRVASFAMIGMANWTAAWYREDGRLTAEQIATQLGDLALRSVASSANHSATHVGGPHESLRLLREAVLHLELMLQDPERNATVSASQSGAGERRSRQE